jgi:hypothetical protein
MVNSGEFVPKRVTAPPIWFTVNRILTRQPIDKYREFGDDSPSRHLHQAARGARPTEPLRTGAD